MKRHFLFVLLILLFSCTAPIEEKKLVLPILGERDIVYKVIDGVEVADTVYHHVPDFEYLNQDSMMVTAKSLKGKVWITDFFFSHCPSICPPMTVQMKRLANNTTEFATDVQFLSFSIDPERDTPARLRNYIKENGISASNWYFFTGDEEETHLLAKEFFNGAERNEDIDGGFGHTSYFALVDKSGLVRGIYDGTNSEQVDKLEKDLRLLLSEEYGIHGSK